MGNTAGAAVTGLAAGLTCGASLALEGGGLALYTAGAYGLSSMAGSTARQAITTGEVDPTQVAVDGAVGAVTAGTLKYVGDKLSTADFGFKAYKGAGKAWGSTNNLVSSAKSTVKGNNTAVGRAFQKHTVRDGTAFTGEITGNAAKNTQQGMNYLNKIVNNPNATFTVRNTNSYGNVLDVRLPDGMGARWSSDGKTFIGFLERFTTK